MITITDAASEKLTDLVAKNKDGVALRIAITGRGAKDFVYDMRIVSEDEAADAGILAEVGELQVYVAEDSAENLQGATIDFNPARGGFQIDNPNPLWTDPLALSVQAVISDYINPGVAQHGGVVTLLDVQDDVAYIELGGGCVGCGMVDVTLKQGIEVMILQQVPEIKSVVDTTDHASGTNPYYQTSKGSGPQYQPAKGGQAPDSPLA